MLALLLLATLSVVLLTMAPALREWLRPSDVQPLSIEEDDALEPLYLARSFALRLADALRVGACMLGRTDIVACGPGGVLPALTAQEQADRVSHRLWHAPGDLELPQGMAFYAEVSAQGVLRTAAHGVYKALWAAQRLQLGSHVSVLRWAHAAEVAVGPDCHLEGRVTAAQRVVLAPGTRFGLLHAPRLEFQPVAARQAAGLPCVGAAAPAGMAWDAASRRAISRGPLVLQAAACLQGDLVCHGDLTLGAGCTVRGSIKVHGGIVAGVGCQVEGSVFATRGIRLGPDCSVRGVLTSEAAVALATGCTVGTPAALSTVCAPRLEIAAGVVVHGTAWAQEHGRCLGASTEGDGATGDAR